MPGNPPGQQPEKSAYRDQSAAHQDQPLHTIHEPFADSSSDALSASHESADHSVTAEEASAQNSSSFASAEVEQANSAGSLVQPASMQKEESLDGESDPDVSYSPEGEPEATDRSISQPLMWDQQSSEAWSYDQYVEQEHYEQYRKLTAPLTHSRPLDQSPEVQEQLASSLQKNQATIWLLAALFIVLLLACVVIYALATSSSANL